MSDASDPALTTGRRTRRLLRTLALPWVVCGGLLGGLTLLTPNPWTSDSYVPDWAATKLQAGWSADWQRPFHPYVFAVAWDTKSQIGDGNRRFEVIWTEVGLASGRGTGWWYLTLSCWWLLMPPVLWSGFNLWRWVQRAE